jgi:hypothetical protein
MEGIVNGGAISSASEVSEMRDAGSSVRLLPEPNTSNHPTIPPPSSGDGDGLDGIPDFLRRLAA